jgi:hypothetical protein
LTDESTKRVQVGIFKIEKGDKGPTLVGEWSPYPGGGTMKDTMKWSRKLD